MQKWMMVVAVGVFFTCVVRFSLTFSMKHNKIMVAVDVLSCLPWLPYLTDSESHRSMIRSPVHRVRRRGQRSEMTEWQNSFKQ